MASAAARAAAAKAPRRAGAGRGRPRLGFVVLNWNGLAHTRRCLDSLVATLPPSDRIVVVDNGSAGGEAAALRAAYPALEHLALPANLGFSGGMNAGIRRARALGCRHVVLLNNDTWAHPGLADALAGPLRDPRVGLVAPRITYRDGTQVWADGGRILWSLGMTRNAGKGLPPSSPVAARPPDFLTGCCLLVRDTVLDEVGLLDDDFFAYYEDVDYSLRARAAGYTLALVPEPLLDHVKSATSATPGRTRFSPLQAYLMARNGLLLARKRLRGGRKALFVLGQFTAMAAWVALRASGPRSVAAYARGLRDGSRRVPAAGPPPAAVLPRPKAAARPA